MLKHAGVARDHLVSMCMTMIWPILEYACHLWHPGINEGHVTTQSRIQKQVLRIIHPGLSYEEAMNATGLPTLESIRIEMCEKVYRDMQKDSHTLHHILPEYRNSKYSFRRKVKYEPPYCIFNF